MLITVATAFAIASSVLYVLALVALKCRSATGQSTFGPNVAAILSALLLSTLLFVVGVPFARSLLESPWFVWPLALCIALLPVAYLPLLAEHTIPWALKEQKHVVILKDERQLSDHWKSETWRKEEMEDDALYLDNDGLERLYGDEYKARRKASRLTLHTLRLSVLARLFNEDVGELRDLFAEEVEEYRRRYELLTGKAFQ